MLLDSLGKWIFSQFWKQRRLESEAEKGEDSGTPRSWMKRLGALKSLSVGTCFLFSTQGKRVREGCKV